MPKQTFTVRLTGGGKNGQVAALQPPFDPVAVFGKRGRIPVRGTVNGAPYRSSLFNMGTGWFMVVNLTLRAQAKCGVGDRVRVTMERDDAKRTIRPPADLKRALAKSAHAQSVWKSSSYTFQKEHVLWLEDAKQAETRTRRLAKLMALLRARELKA
jgi:bacteriocin resistance YdeI/OmpD-like protein/uncharacterized protein DUF1905